jgi:ribosomal protein L40E
MSEERKLCPNCGHSNRAAAKNCTQCGFAFFNAASSDSSNNNAASDNLLRKRCQQCGAMNRMGAKVCVQCGKAFRGKFVTFRQKWCPQCGAERRPNAKVCSFCGYRFKPESAPVVVEPPVVQSNELSMPISTRKDSPHTPAPIAAEVPKVPQGVRTPDLTSAAVPTEAPIMQSNDLADPIKMRSTTGTTPTPKPPDLSGEPAPYLSPDELSRLRRMGDQTTGLFIRRDKKR